MNATWIAYTFPLDGSIAYAVVDIDALRGGLLHGRPWLCTVDLPLLDPDYEGHVTEAEAVILSTIEATLERLLRARHDARFVGRFTLDGRRVFCFYSPGITLLQETVDAILGGFPAYTPVTTILDDPDWAVYSTLLYPSTSELERIIARSERDAAAAFPAGVPAA